MIKKIALEKLLMPTSEKQPSKEKEQPFREKKDKEAPKRTSKPVTEKEACEFLKFVKHSEYSVIEQLNKILQGFPCYLCFKIQKFTVMTF